jgi:hypothetical protein
MTNVFTAENQEAAEKVLVVYAYVRLYDRMGCAVPTTDDYVLFAVMYSVDVFHATPN